MSAYHYCCGHSASHINADGVVRPTAQIWTDTRLSWWTTMEQPDPLALGLTSVLLSCDRTEHRYASIAESLLTPWPLWAIANGVPDYVIDLLHHDGSRPDTWLVATRPVPVRIKAGAAR